MKYAMPSTTSSHRAVSRLHRLLTLINEIKTNPRQTPAALWTALGVGKTMFYKDKAELAGLGFAFEYRRPASTSSRRIGFYRCSISPSAKCWP